MSYGHPRSPGYIPGDHWVTCDRCGFDVRSSRARKTWDGLVVCPDDWEPRHPQDFVRGREDRQAAQGLVRPEPAEVTQTFTEPGQGAKDDTSVLSGTFDNSL